VAQRPRIAGDATARAVPSPSATVLPLGVRALVFTEPVIDLHCHVLPGIDDGPERIEGSVALARAAANAGVHTLVATPHVSSRYRNDANTIARLVDVVNARLTDEGVALEVLSGAEIAITSVIEIAPEQLSRLGLGGGDWLLMEPPFSAVASGLENILSSLQREGHRIMLAHPERCPAFHRDPAMLRSIVRTGVLTSVTAGSLVGRFGSEVRRFALGLIAEGLVHNVASDAHDHARRPPGMAAELDEAGLGPLADWLTRAVPSAILGGEATIPPRPAVELPPITTTRRGWWRQHRDRFTQAS
jgi:protein-tyrosine phosphatase